MTRGYWAAFLQHNESMLGVIGGSGFYSFFADDARAGDHRLHFSERGVARQVLHGHNALAHLVVAVAVSRYTSDRPRDEVEARRKVGSIVGLFPVLHVDGVLVTQSDAITRYAGKLAGLYPTDPYQALLCDEVLSAVEDANIKLGTSFGLREVFYLFKLVS